MKPFFVTVDHKRKEVLVTIRGTLSETDAITDIIAVPADIPGYQHEGYKAHKVGLSRYVLNRGEGGGNF